MRLLRLGDQAPISAMITTVPIIPYPNIKILLAAGGVRSWLSGTTRIDMDSTFDAEPSGGIAR